MLLAADGCSSCGKLSPVNGLFFFDWMVQSLSGENNSALATPLSNSFSQRVLIVSGTGAIGHLRLNCEPDTDHGNTRSSGTPSDSAAELGGTNLSVQSPLVS